MKFLIVFALFFSAMSLRADSLPADENRAVVVKVLGGFTGFDPDGYKVVRSAMATLIVDGVVDHFITRAYGHEGGHEFCVELTPDPAISISKITKMLLVIKPANRTIYEFEEVVSCRD